MGKPFALFCTLVLSTAAAPVLLMAQDEATDEASSAPPKETFQLVQIESINKTLSYSILTPAELKAFEKEIALEKKLAPKALKAADLEWKKQYKKLFPRSQVNLYRSFSKMGSPYTERQRAVDKKTDMEESLKWKVQDQRNKDYEKVNALRESLKNVTDRNEAKRISDRLRKMEKNLKDKEQAAKRAADVYATQMNDLVTAELDRQQKAAEAKSDSESGSGN